MYTLPAFGRRASARISADQQQMSAEKHCRLARADTIFTMTETLRRSLFSSQTRLLSSSSSPCS